MPATFHPIDEQGVDGELYVVEKNGVKRMPYLCCPPGVHSLARPRQTSPASSSAGQMRFTCIT